MAKTIIAATRLSEPEYKHLEQIAKDDRRSVSQMQRIIIQDYLKLHRPKQRIQAQPYSYAKG